MGTPTQETKPKDQHPTRNDAIAGRRKEERDRLPSSDGAVDGMLASIGGDSLRNLGDGGSKEVDPASHAEGQIQQIGMIQNAIFDVVRDGIKRGLDAIEKPEELHESNGGALGELLALAASLALAGAGGGIAAWVAQDIGSAVTKKLVENTVKEAVKRAFAPRPAKGPRSLDDLKEAFGQQLVAASANIKNRFALEWSQMHDRLSVLPSAALTKAIDDMAQVLNTDTSTVIDQVADQTVIAWTNFVARAKYGGMRPWDFWAKNGGNGAIALDGAAAAPKAVNEDPTRGNVNPWAMAPSLDFRQRPMQDEHFGILEIFVDVFGHLIADPDYRMRLDNVGPGVRRRLAQLGRVRDLKINKVVRVCSLKINPPIPIASLLITADGYVRGTNWVNFHTMTLHHHKPLGLGYVRETLDCHIDLVHGKQTPDCHLNPEVDAKAIAAVAEQAQDLSLRHLEA
jgi:hypothetical protein